MERVIQLLEHKRDQLAKIRYRQDQQFSIGKDITTKDVVFYDQELHEQLDDAIGTLEIFSEERRSELMKSMKELKSGKYFKSQS